MKGIIFNLLEEYISEKLGEDKYDELMHECKFDERDPFVGPLTYPDEDFLCLFTTTVTNLKLDPKETLHDFGRFCFKGFNKRYPNFIEPYKNAREFLLTVEDIHFIEVAKLYKDAYFPHFTYSNVTDNHVTLGYKSHRKLCYLMEGLIEGVAKHFNTTIKYSQSECMHDGCDECVFELDFV